MTQLDSKFAEFTHLPPSPISEFGSSVGYYLEEFALLARRAAPDITTSDSVGISAVLAGASFGVFKLSGLVAGESAPRRVADPALKLLGGGLALLACLEATTVVGDVILKSKGGLNRN